jgi:hypothetical protein
LERARVSTSFATTTTFLIEFLFYLCYTAHMFYPGGQGLSDDETKIRDEHLITQARRPGSEIRFSAENKCEPPVIVPAKAASGCAYSTLWLGAAGGLRLADGLGTAWADDLCQTISHLSHRKISHPVDYFVGHIGIIKDTGRG